MSKKIREAIGALADLFEFGHLMADTQPIAFLGEVVLEVTGLRARVAELERELAAARELVRDNQTRWLACAGMVTALRAAIDAAVVELSKFQVDEDEQEMTVDAFDVWEDLAPVLNGLRAAQKAAK